MFFRRCFQATADDDNQENFLLHHIDEVEEEEEEDIPSLIRKVRSLDFGSLRRPTSESSWCCSPDDTSPSCGDASRFGHRRRFQPLSRRLSGTKSPFLSPLLRSDSDNTEVFEDSDTERQASGDSSVVMRLLSGRRWTVGYLSVMMLACITFSNFALEIVHAQMHRLDSPSYYDALSRDVLAPPMRYKSSVLGARRRLGLGMAAISSVTSALSPILPFTGGVDLRREELWDTEGGWFHTASSMVDQVRDAFGLEPLRLDTSGVSLLSRIPRSGGQAFKDERVQISSGGTSSKRRKTEHVSTLSARKPFVSVDDIAKLTLSDLTTFVEYAMENNRAKFQKAKFMNGVNDRVKPLLAAMDGAIAKSRGKDVEPARTGACMGECMDGPLSQSVGYGDVDALQFCAAMRLFAEWRVVRQVPEGYKGYAVGMNLGHKDIVQNVAKIEQAVHDWIDYRRELIELQTAWQDAEGCPGDCTSMRDDCELRSPTLRDLLEHEIDMDVHRKLPRLKEKSAAMGLLWVRRQLHYQTSIFSNILKVPDEFPTSNSAVSAAYNEVYGQYHGWAVQKIFNYSFQAAPEVERIYKFMNPHRLKDAVQEAGKIISNSLHMKSSDEIDDGDILLPEMNPIERLFDAVARLFGQGDAAVSNNELGMRGGGSDLDHHDHYVTKVMEEDAHAHILVYLDKVQPLLRDLAGLFDDLNMDDPTKV